MTIGFIGAGNMARAIITGLLAKNAVTPEEIVLHGGQPIHYEPYAAKIGAKAVASNQAVADTADIVFLAVAPKLGVPILKKIGPTLKQRQVPMFRCLPVFHWRPLKMPLAVKINRSCELCLM